MRTKDDATAFEKVKEYFARREEDYFHITRSIVEKIRENPGYTPDQRNSVAKEQVFQYLLDRDIILTTNEHAKIETTVDEMLESCETEQELLFDRYIQELDEKAPASALSTEAAESAADALSFAQSLWDLLQDNGLMVESSTPDFAVMEKAIDLLYGELHSVTMMFSGDEFAKLPQVFDATADAIANAPNSSVVPNEVIRGYRDFANRLRNASASRKSMARKLEETVTE